MASFAFPLGQCAGLTQTPFIQEVSSVPFVECTAGIDNFSAVLAFDFGATVSDYALQLSLPDPSSFPVSDVRVLPSWGQVTNARLDCTELFGMCISPTLDYTAAGHWDAAGAGSKLFSIEVDLMNGLTWGRVGGYPDINFTSLTDPPDAPADTPEPGTLLLISPSLAAVFLSRRYFSRSIRQE